MFHLENCLSVEEGALRPWTISGTLIRTAGDGVSEVPMRIEVKDDNGVNIPLPTFYVNISGGENAQQAWSFDFVHTCFWSILWQPPITAAIDPYGTASFIQESTEMIELVPILTSSISRMFQSTRSRFRRETQSTVEVMSIGR